MDIIKTLEGLGYTPLDRMEAEISLWEQFFIGKVKDFHSHTDLQGAEIGSITRTRESLKMAKVICEIWEDNIIDPETDFVVDDGNEEKTDQTWIEDYIKRNRIKERLNCLMELTFAEGTGGTVQYQDAKGNVINQYVSVDYCYPLRETNGEIDSCAFVSNYTDKITSIQIHEQLDDGKYRIKNLFFYEEG